MLRRELLPALAVAGLSRAAEQTRRDMVSTPAGRAGYLRTMLAELCTKLGPRPSGSKSYEAGASLVLSEMRRSMPSVVRDTVTFKRWVAVGEPLFLIGEKRLETYVADNSPGTPPGGVRGTLRKRGQYELVDSATDRVMARAGISEFGRAIVTIHSGTDDVPLFNIGRQDAEMLDRAVKENTPVEARAKVKWIAGVKTSSVAGTLPGETKEEILVVAHADTKYNTPGAHDNTASLVTMLMLAHARPAARAKRTVTFLATTGEEQTFFGAKHYAETRRHHGTLGNIKVCVNLDSLTYGPNLQINTTDRELARTILDIHRDLGIRAEPKTFHRDDTMDSAPFGASGARCVHLNSRGDDARTLPLWHRPEDRAETINADFVESSFRVLHELIERLAR